MGAAMMYYKDVVLVSEGLGQCIKKDPGWIGLVYYVFECKITTSKKEFLMTPCITRAWN